jgi:threonine synthase
MRVRCFDCGRVMEYQLEDWRCTCGGAWEPILSQTFEPNKIESQEKSIWRYGEYLGLDIQKPLVRMGVGWTPLVPIQIADREIHLKLEYLSPSGSFKDRGVNAMVNQLVHMGVKSVSEDSSGNAGASLAAHAARFGIPAKIFVPAYASQAKLQQIAVYGAEVIPVPGPRSAAQDAAQASIGPGRAYASHAYNPAYLAGQVTAAWELWEQLEGEAPDWIICPVAQGGQFLGYWFGFSLLLKSGLIDHLPHLVVVQSVRIAPIYHAWSQGLKNIPAVEAVGPTVAEGVAITKPARGKRLLQALLETDGRVLAVEEEEILTAQKELAHWGYYIEPTSALVFAGFKRLKDEIKEGDIVVLPLTGNGLKGVPKGMDDTDKVADKT